MNFADKKYILMDLDGTVTDSSEGIVNSVLYALKRFGIEETDRKSVERFIGPPLSDSFEQFYGFSQEDAYKAVDVYREYYADRGIFENRVYDGVADFLKWCKAQGKVVLLATSKPTVFAKRILEHFQLAEFFAYCVGSELNGERVHKHDVIAYCLEQAQITNISQAVMIGDRCFDIDGAHHFGMDAVGVLYGFGTRKEFETANAEWIVSSLSELMEQV